MGNIQNLYHSSTFTSDADGNVGIGTTSPGDALVVKGGSPGNIDLVSFQNNAGNETHRFYADSANDGVIETVTNAGVTANLIQSSGDSWFNGGNVGIGITAPGAKLNVVHTASASVPALQIASSASLASNDIVRFQINGLTNGFRMFQNASSVLNYTFQDGNVGIGTTNPTTPLHVGGIVQIVESGNTAFYEGNGVRVFGTQNYRFRNTGGGVRAIIDVNSTGVTAGNLSLYNASNVVTTKLHNAGDSYLNGGNVGIGTTSPSTKLDVDGAITAGTANSTSGSVLMYGKYSNGHLATIGTEYSNGGLVLGYGVTPSTTAAGGFVSSSASTNLTRGAYSFAAGTHKWWSDPVNATIAVGTTSPLNNTMTLLDTGELGIGTTTPYGRLELNGSGQNWATAPTIRMWDSFNAKGWLIGNVNNTTVGDFYIRTLPAIDGNPGNGQQEFTIKHTTGNVGIGTTSPSVKFQVDAGSNIASFRSVGSGQNNKEFLIQSGGDRVVLDSKNADDGTATALAFELGSSEKIRIIASGNVGIGTTAPSQKLHVAGNARVTGAFYDSTNSPGTAGQVLSSTATGTDWVAAGSGSTVYTAAIWEVDSDIFTADNTTIVCDTNRIYNGTTSVSTAGPTAGSLVMDVAGVYEISYSVAVRVPQSGAPSTRQVPALYLTLTPDGGTEAKIPGSLNSTYLRLYGSNQGGFTSFSNKIYVETDENGEVQLKIVWLDGTDKDVEIYSAAGIQNTISIRRIT